LVSLGANVGGPRAELYLCLVGARLHEFLYIHIYITVLLGLARAEAHASPPLHLPLGLTIIGIERDTLLVRFEKLMYKNNSIHSYIY